MPFRTLNAAGSSVSTLYSVIEGYYDALNRSDPASAARLVGLDPSDDSIWLRLRGSSPSVDAQMYILSRAPSLADETRYPVVAEIKAECAFLYYDAVRGGWFKKVWRRIKGFCKKAWKALPKVLGIAKKVATVAAPLIPPPYGTAVAGIASATGAVSNALNLIGNVSQKTTGLALMDTSEDKFIVTPQYRVSASSDDYIMPNVPGNEYVPNTVYNGEWISGDPIEVPVNRTSALSTSTVFNLEDHPNYANIRQYVSTALAAGNETPLWFQQRLKINFTKTGVPSQEAADNYKATLRVGSDTYVDTGDE